MKHLLEQFDKDGRLQRFLMENKDMIIKVTVAGLLVAVAFFVFTLRSDEEETPVVDDAAMNMEEMETSKESIFVDIGGEVANPMVAELEEGSRVEDAIRAAGGVTANADLTEINRAAFVEDGEKIYIPSLLVAENETYVAAGGAGAAATYSDGKVNINTADSLELQELNGVGPATAEKIIDYREEYGRFQSIEDLKNVSGIGDKTFEKLKDDIKV